MVHTRPKSPGPEPVPWTLKAGCCWPWEAASSDSCGAGGLEVLDIGRARGPVLQPLVQLALGDDLAVDGGRRRRGAATGERAGQGRRPPATAVKALALARRPRRPRERGRRERVTGLTAGPMLVPLGPAHLGTAAAPKLAAAPPAPRPGRRRPATVPRAGPGPACRPHAATGGPASPVRSPSAPGARCGPPGAPAGVPRPPLTTATSRRPRRAHSALRWPMPSNAWAAGGRGP